MTNDEKLSEIIGLLKSINYDGVINDLEIDSLKNWINVNRNSSNPLYRRIVEKLEKILLDNIITDDEKNEIISIIDKFNNSSNFFNTKYELIGIVKGILADNEINAKEIVKFADWLNYNSQLKGYDFYDKLVSLVSDVLNDGMLDEKEVHKFKIFLSLLLKDNELSQKINLLRIKVDNLEIIGNDLINLIDDSTIINKIHQSAEKQLKTLLKNNCSVYAIDSEIVFISLSLIALLNYDGSYYDFVAKTYSELYDKFSEQKIEGKIRNVINKYKLDDDPRIISLVIKNSIVPKYFLPSFFEFIYDIYRLNFEFNLDPKVDLYDEISFVYDGIKKLMNTDNDELDLKVTNKTYSLIKTTKDIILDDSKIKSLIELSVSVLKIIDEYYWSNSFNMKNEYFTYGFENWKNKMDKTIQENKRESNGIRSRWEPEFKLRDKEIYLVIPNHKIRSNYDYSKLKVEIFNDNELIYENNRLNVYDIIGGYRIENPDVLIEKPLGKITYRLLCDEEIIYDSKEKLFRDYIFFNSSGNEQRNNRDYNGLIILCSKEEVQSFDKMSKRPNYLLSYRNVNVGDYVKINDEIFNFTTILSPGIIGNKLSSKLCKNNKCYDIYDDVTGIVYESERLISNILISINNKKFRLTDLVVEEKKRGIYNNYFIKLDLRLGEYNVLIEEYEDTNYCRKKEFFFVIDDNFDFNIEKSINNEYLIKINYLNNDYIKTVTLLDDDICSVNFENYGLIFDVPLNIQLYKIDSDSWFELSDLNNYIWIKDITTYCNLRTIGIKYTCAKIIDENGNLLTTLYPSESGNYYDLSIGTLKSYEHHEYIYIDFYNESLKIGFLKCYCRCAINLNTTKIYYNPDDNLYHGIICYYGKGNISIVIDDSLGNVIYQNSVSCGEEITVAGLESFKEYHLRIIEKKFGFTLEKDNLLYKTNIKYYSLNDFVGKYFQIYLVYFDQSILKKLIRKDRQLYNTYVEIVEQIDEQNFIGNLYIYKGEKRYLDKLNPVEIEFTSEIKDGQIEAIITKDGDGLFNDFEHHTILNEPDSKTAVDIYSYVINMERRR